MPKIGDGEMLIKVMASGGSDVMEWYRSHKVPLILGHEVGGEIVGRCALVQQKYKRGGHALPISALQYPALLERTSYGVRYLRKTTLIPWFCRVPSSSSNKWTGGVFLLPDEAPCTGFY